MATIERSNDASLAGFLAGWDKRLQENEQLPVHVAVLALTNFGERPVPSARLAGVLGRPVSEAEARAQGHCTTATLVEDPLARVEDGLITFINPERAKSAPRRQLQIGDRRFGMAGCAFGVFLYAPLGWRKPARRPGRPSGSWSPPAVSRVPAPRAPWCRYSRRRSSTGWRG